ncbi:hypothetical protein ABRY94_11740 [Castellaniella ginsengisoli]|uniref:Norphogenetic protein n=1 Tax=Castellaniella ginsengisoli TaxID=546114 RepID=A0AB39ENE2_9BURK
MKTVAVIASGPSLTQADCDLIEEAGIPAIAVNDSWRMARFAQIVFAGDGAWWDAHIGAVDIPAARWTSAQPAAERYGLNRYPWAGEYNSGALAVQLAAIQGAERAILIGADCSIARGLHWHGPHEKTKNPTADRVRLWHQHYAQAGAIAAAGGCEVVNCSRHTDLTCFPVRNLESEIERFNRDLAVARQSAV